MRSFLPFFICTTILFSCSNDKDQDFIDILDPDGNKQEVDKNLNKKSVGDSANDMLSDTNFSRIAFELYYVDGQEPSTQTVQNFESFLSARLNKSGGISVELSPIASPGKEVYSITDIRNIEDDIRKTYNTDDTVSVFGIFIDGEYAENTENGSVLGVAYRNTSFVVFEETIKQFSGQALAPSRTTLETVVTNHEFGHLLGLVNAGTTPQSDHQDVAHGRHCTVESCLMFWTAETGEGLLNMLSGGSIPELDAQCLADLAANGGK
ncbi:membrane metalloprotease [Aggregatimonas sangjinii]|uniref:Membrane metalloprotease n=1 Tax=Aggregatimonas sangjinii TaxID=2583587 RepID=A0A5B7SMM0_9FLAO|nr:membrane metalloprotease [Aggregatimonas sangjinii]QCW99746.1 membrane metalloprotease [Aggregatimonas sangjinii]